jgi:hypothetical protein
MEKISNSTNKNIITIDKNNNSNSYIKNSYNNNNDNINKKNLMADSKLSYCDNFYKLEDIIKNYSINSLINKQTFDKNKIFDKNVYESIKQNKNTEIISTIKNLILNKKLFTMKILSMFNESNFEKFIQELKIKSKFYMDNLFKFMEEIDNMMKKIPENDIDLINFLFKINQNYSEKFIKIKSRINFYKIKNLKEIKKSQKEFNYQREITNLNIFEGTNKIMPIVKELRCLENKIQEKSEKFSEKENYLKINSIKTENYQKELMISSEKYSISLKKFNLSNDEINQINKKKILLIKEISNLEKCLKIIKKNENLKYNKKVLKNSSSFHQYYFPQRNKRILLLNENELLERNSNVELIKFSELNENFRMRQNELNQIMIKILSQKNIKKLNDDQNKNINNNFYRNEVVFKDYQNEIGLKFLKEILTYKFVQIKIKKLKEKEKLMTNLNISMETLLIQNKNSEKNLLDLNKIIENYIIIRNNLKDSYYKKKSKFTKYKNLNVKLN